MRRAWRAGRPTGASLSTTIITVDDGTPWKEKELFPQLTQHSHDAMSLKVLYSLRINI